MEVVDIKKIMVPNLLICIYVPSLCKEFIVMLHNIGHSKGGVTNKEKNCWYLLWMAPNIYYWGSWSYLHNTSNVFTELGILHSTFYRGRVAGRVVHTMYMYVVQIIRKRSPTYVPRAQKPKTPSWASKPLFRSVTFTSEFLFFYLLFFQPVGFQGVSLTNFSLMNWKF